MTGRHIVLKEAMINIAKSGRIFSICDCTKGKDLDQDRKEIIECQKKQSCWEAGFGQACLYYRPSCGHCDRNNYIKE